MSSDIVCDLEKYFNKIFYVQNIRFNKGDLVISIQISAANDDSSNNNKIFSDIEHKHKTLHLFSFPKNLAE